GPEGLARDDGDALNEGAAVLGQPKGRAPDATSGVEDPIALRDTRDVRHHPIHVVERLSVPPGSLVPVPEVDGRIPERHPQQAVVEPGFLVIRDHVRTESGPLFGNHPAADRYGSDSRLGRSRRSPSGTVCGLRTMTPRSQAG